MIEKSKHTLYIVPTTKHVGLENLGQTLIHVFKAQRINAVTISAIPSLETALSKLVAHDTDTFLETILEQYYACAEKNDVIIIEGIPCDDSHPYLERLNINIAQMLNAKIIFLTDGLISNAALFFMINSFRELKEQWLGCILNQISNKVPDTAIEQLRHDLTKKGLSLLADIPFFKKNDSKDLVLAYVEHIASKDSSWLETFIHSPIRPLTSPLVFQHQLIKRAIAANKHIVLPEGDEPRTICAANVCAEKEMAKLTLLGDKNKIQAVAKQQNITLHEGIKIVDPNNIAERYVDLLVKLRRHKGMTHALATQALQDRVMLGTLMLYNGDVDGLVSGAVHSTANTIRPALQVIKTKPDIKLVSSVFFMCLPSVSVYADCAINPNPSVEDLADIAIESAGTAKTFGISPRIAMLSYSSGTSAKGADVDQVKNAVESVKKRRPDLLIDGPLQYDAASVESVAKQKVPHSPLAGNANVFIFPNLNTGNTTYKAVQRSAHIVSIGPVLQGLNKPVNDLSRGSSIKDIIYTIAVTAVQATAIVS